MKENPIAAKGEQINGLWVATLLFGKILELTRVQMHKVEGCSLLSPQSHVYNGHFISI